MPITPFHFGPGALIKVIAPRHFSWTIFALANVLIDLEPAFLFLLTGDPAHPWLHTLPGAVGVAALAAVFGRRPCEWLLRWWSGKLAPGWQRRWLAVEPRIPIGTAWVSAFIGTLSHLGLDSIMHADVQALWPIIRGNPIQGAISLDSLHALCVAAAVVALIGLLLFRRVRGTAG
jgi:hypothetical protein